MELNNESKKLVSPLELAEKLKVPVSWIYQRTRFGPTAIPHIKFGKYLRFDPEEVIAFFARKEKDNAGRPR